VILAGRRINDSMGNHVVDRVIKLMTRRKVHVVDANVLILGLAFKENCPDIRNTRVVDLVSEFRSYHANVHVYDPWVTAKDAKHEYGIDLATTLTGGYYDAIVIAVAHDDFKQMGIDQIRGYGKPECVIFDVKQMFPRGQVSGRL
jgi:UDP-N-acetyl-D-glucosamine/UDP-N-acetyl-D-galactosamine dehydrogenase